MERLISTLLLPLHVRDPLLRYDIWCNFPVMCFTLLPLCYNLYKNSVVVKVGNEPSSAVDIAEAVTFSAVWQIYLKKTVTSS